MSSKYSMESGWNSFQITDLEAVARGCSVKKALLEVSQNLQENTCARVSFLKKRLWHRRFPVNVVKFIRAPFFTVHFYWLLLQIDRLFRWNRQAVLRKKLDNLGGLEKSIETVKSPVVLGEIASLHISADKYSCSINRLRRKKLISKNVRALAQEKLSCSPSALLFSSARRCSIKNVFLEISQNSQENTSVRVSFLIKLQACNSDTDVFLWILRNF